MLLNNESERSKRIEIKKKKKKRIINDFCYILRFICMIINNNFLEYIYFFIEKFCSKFINLLKIY